MIREGIIELMDERFQAFISKLAVGQYGARTLSFKDFMGCGASEFLRVKDPIASRRWITDIESDLEGSKVRFVAGCLRERDRYLWKEVGYALGSPTIEAMTRPNFVTRF